MFRTLAFVALLFALAPSTSHAGYPTLVQVKQALRQHGPAILNDAGLRASTFKRIGPDLQSHPGATSVVFPMTDAAGKQWAVRAFTRQPPHDRHEAITRAISESGLGEGGTGLFPEVQYIKQGIQLTVDGKQQWFPIVKMAWVTGKRLDQHIDSLVASGKHGELDQLAEDWRAAHASMRAKNIAHGDLQHGNIMVKPDGKLQLIDLDDVFIESFRGQQAGGFGHPNYANPTREGRDFYLDVDNFSSLVIYTSLKAIAHDPSLYKDPKIHGENEDGGFDNILFQKSDFENPEESHLLKRLAKSPSPEIRKLGAFIAEYSMKHVSEVPALEHLLAGKAWKPDGTVPADFEREAVEAEDEEPAAAASPKVAPRTTTELKEPGANATPMQWQMYRMKLVQQKNLR